MSNDIDSADLEMVFQDVVERLGTLEEPRLTVRRLMDRLTSQERVSNDSKEYCLLLLKMVGVRIRERLGCDDTSV